MNKVLNILIFITIIIFFSITFNYYSSNKNINNKKYNRSNIDQIIKDKVIDLPILKSDTNNVIEFNDGFSDKIKNEKKRSFWNLLKIK